MISISPSVAWSTPTFTDVVVFSLCLFLMYNIVFAIYNLYFNPLASFPGPPLSAISRLPLIGAHLAGKLYKHFDALHAQYGSLVRVAPNELTVCSAAAWKDIYQSRPPLPKDPWSLTPPPNGVDSLFTADGPTHTRLRRAFVDGFSDKALRMQASIIESYTSLFISRIRREIFKSNEGIVDVAKYYGYITLDIVGDLAFGEPFHSLEGYNENVQIAAYRNGAKFGSIRTSLSRFHPLELVFGWIFLRLTAKARAANLKAGTDMISRRLGLGDLGASRSDFLSPIIGNMEEEEAKRKAKVSRMEININVIAIAMAGSGLPMVAMSAATYFLLRYPETINRLNQEVRTSFRTEAEITVPSTVGLLYLEAVITETLRIHHPTPSHLPRVVGPGGMYVDERWIPGGTVIGIPLHTIQTSPANWVEPRGFHPERWLPKSHSLYDSRFENDNKEAYRPFSAGSRNCMGGKVFLAEARVILARMIWNFDMELAKKDDYDWPDQRAYLLFEAKPLMVKFKERDFGIEGSECTI